MATKKPDDAAVQQLTPDASAGTTPEDRERAQVIALRKLPRATQVQALLATFQERGGLADDVRALLATITPQYAEVEGDLVRIQSEITSAILAESDATMQRDIGVLQNRASSAIQTLRDIQARTLDLARLVSDMMAEVGGVTDRAVERRGYTDPRSQD